MNSSVCKRNRKRGKEFEKRVASLLGGERKGLFGGEDIDLGDYSVECKSRVKFAGRAWMDQAKRHSKGKKPVVVVIEKGAPLERSLVLIEIGLFQELKKGYHHPHIVELQPGAAPPSEPVLP